MSEECSLKKCDKRHDVKLIPRNLVNNMKYIPRNLINNLFVSSLFDLYGRMNLKLRSCKNMFDLKS